MKDISFDLVINSFGFEFYGFLDWLPSNMVVKVMEKKRWRRTPTTVAMVESIMFCPNGWNY